MSEPRLKAGLWVKAALRLGNDAGRFGAVLRKGDPDAGGVLVVLRGPEGLAVLTQSRDMEGRPVWVRASGPAPVEQAAADAFVDKQVGYDPDLWVIEFEAPDMLPPFEGKVI